jgi:hypothetical protein
MEPGWSDSLVLDYDRAAIRSPSWRIKEWDYYCVLARDFALALTVADNGYMGLLSASFLDLAARSEESASAMTAFPMGSWRLPSGSGLGVTEADSRGARLRFEAEEGRRRLSFSWTSFASDGRGLEGEITLREQPGRASMVIATPFVRPRRGFYYNQKINCQAAEGFFRLGDREIALPEGSAYAVLDWGRGVWPWSNSWLWGSASGCAARDAKGSALRSDNGEAARDAKGGALRSDNGEAARPFGFNIGYGFGDTSAASENMVFYDGRAHKIGRLSIDMDKSDFLKPWRAVSEDGRLDLVLEPILDRASATDLGLLASIQHQVFGRWRGRAILDDGSSVEFEELPGFCEKVVNRW